MLRGEGMEGHGIFDNRIYLLTALLCAAAVILIFFRDLAADAISILFGAGVICFLVSPLEKWIARRVPQPWSVILALAAVGIAVIGISAAAVPMISAQIGSGSGAITAAAERISEMIRSLKAAVQAKFPSVPIPDFSQIGGGISEFAKNALDYIGTFSDRIYRVLLMIALSYFFLADREHTLIRMELIAPSAIRRHAVRFGRALMHELRLYVRGQATIALAVGLLACAGLLIIGVPGWPLLGLIVGIFNVIPYFGPILGGIPAVLMAFGISWQRALITIGMLFLVQQIDGLVISPRIMGSVTGFSPGAVLLALYFGSRLGGIGGLLLAVPALTAIRTLYRVFVQRYEM